MEAEKPKIKVSVEHMSGEGPHPCLQMAPFFLYPHKVGRDDPSHVSFYERFNVIHEDSAFMT